jgi:hypothetical protein
MLREIAATRQHPNEPPRRWFHSHEMDLFVWSASPGEIVKFQLTYDKPKNERALTWDATLGYTHDEVDDGTSGTQHPGTPLLLRSTDPDIEHVLSRFDIEAVEVEGRLRTFICEKLKRYASSTLPATSTPPENRLMSSTENSGAVLLRLMSFFGVLIFLLAIISRAA